MTWKPKWPETDEYFAHEKRIKELIDAATVQKEMNDESFFTEQTVPTTIQPTVKCPSD